MAWPFTQLATFIANSVPKITAAFLNSQQQGINAVAFPAYDRIKYVASCIDGTNVVFASIGPYMALDSATSQYVGMPAVTSVVVTGFTHGVWNCIYARVTNSVVAYSASTAGPEATLRYMSGAGNESYRYLCSVYVNGSGAISIFSAIDGEYVWGAATLFGSTMPGTGWTPVTAAAGTIAPTAKQMRVQGGASAGAYLIYRPTGSSIAATPTLGVCKSLAIENIGSTFPPDPDKGTMDVFVNTSLTADFSSGTAFVTVYIWVESFKE
jgi:hypothetical protein